MKILITGGTAFVSKYTAEYFVTNGYDVTVLNRGSKEQIEGVRLIQADRLSLGDALSGSHFDAVLDITAYTEEHIRALLSSGVSFDDYILISSSAVYPETNPQPFSEEQVCGYNHIWGNYGINKLKAEQYLTARVPHSYILRPPYFYGKYENLYREPFVFDCAVHDRPFCLPQDGRMKLQFFHVKDLCWLIEILVRQHPDHHILNVGNKETVTIKEWVELCYRAADKTPRFISVDKSIPQRDYFCFYDYEYVLDVSKQNEILKPTVTLSEGLKEEFEWYRANPDSVQNRKPYLSYIDQYIK